MNRKDLHCIATAANASRNVDARPTYEERKISIDATIENAAKRGEYFYTYSGLNEDEVLKLAKEYDNNGFLISVRKDRYNELWSLYLNWS